MLCAFLVKKNQTKNITALLSIHKPMKYKFDLFT